MPFSNGFLTEFEKFGCKWSGFRSVEGGKGIPVSSLPESLDCVAMAKELAKNPLVTNYEKVLGNYFCPSE